MPRWMLLVAAVGAFAAAVAVVGARTVANLNVPGDPQRDQGGMADFRDAVYYSGRALIDGVNPYDHEAYSAAYPVGNIFPLYSPLVPLLHLPLAACDGRTAQVLFFALMVALLPLFTWLVLTACGRPPSLAIVFFAAAALAISRPGIANLVVGQLAIEFALATVAAFHYARSRPWLAAVAIAVATAKPTFGIPLVAMLIARRDWAALVRGLTLAAVVAAFGLGLIAARSGGVSALVASIPANHAALNADPSVSPQTAFMRVDAYATFSRLTGNDLGGGVEFAIWAGGTIVCAAVVARMMARDRSPRAMLLAATIGALASMTLFYHLIYDALLLAFPLAAVALGGGEHAILSCRRRWFLAGLVAVPLVNYFITNSAITFIRTEAPAAYLPATTVAGLALVAALAGTLKLAAFPAPSPQSPTPTSPALVQRRRRRHRHRRS